MHVSISCTHVHVTLFSIIITIIIFMMASREQSRIQAYLETNKIGPLFEEMMTRLISETPDQPVPFLITHLQGKKGSPVLLKNVLLGSAALWAQTPAHSKGVRWNLNGNEKSWQEHPRRPKKSKSDLEVCNLSPPSPESKSLPRSAEHPCWDSRTRPESNDFDELSHILQESKKLGKALESLSRSMAAVDEFYQEPIPYNTPPPRPRVIGQWAGREDSDADPLAAEMLHPLLPREKSEDSSPSGRLKVEPKRRGLKQQQQQHKKQLAALLSQENSSAGPDPSATELDIEDEDDAMELMEDLEDLWMEGVTSLAPCRNKVIQVHGSHSSQPQAKLTLNICSRCARFQGDGLAGTREDSREEEPPTTQEVPEVPCSPSKVKTTLKEGSENEHPPQVTGANPSVSGFKLTAVRDWSTISQNQQKEPQSLGRYASANRGEELTKMTEDSSEMNSNSPLSSLLLSPLVLQSLSLPDQPSKPTSSLSLPSNKPTSLLLGPPQAFSNKPIAPLGSSMLTPVPSSRHSNMEKSARAFSEKIRAVTPTSHAGWNIPFTPHNQAGWNRPVTPTHQPECTLHTMQASLSGWSRTNTSTNQVGWSIPTMPIDQPGRSRSLTPTEQAGWSKTFMPSNFVGRSRSVTPTDPAGWSRSITLSSQGRRSVPATPTDACGWSRIITPSSQGRRSRPITPTDQAGRSRSVTPTDLYGWSKPITPTSQGRRSRPVTPTDTVGLSRPVTPTDLYGWSKPITPTSQGRRSRPVTPTDMVGLSRPVTPTSQGRRSRPVTPTEMVGLSRPVTPTSQGRRSRPVTPTETVGLSRPVTPTSQGRRSRPVTPTDSIGWSRPVTPTDQAGWSRPITPTSHGRRSRPVTPTDQTGRSRSVTPTNQAGRSRPSTPTDHTGRHLLTPTSLSSELLWPTINQTSVLSEAEFYQQLQAMRQPWLLPSDTDSENGVADGGPV